MRSIFSEEITSLARREVTLLRGGAIQLYRWRRSGASVLAAVPVFRESSGALTQLRYEYDIRTAAETVSPVPVFASLPIRRSCSVVARSAGQMLSDLVGAALHVDQFLRVAVKVALALASAHASSWFTVPWHRANIMLHRECRRAWLTGFRPVNVSPAPPTTG